MYVLHCYVFIFGLTTDCDDYIVDRAELEEFEDTKGLSDSVNRRRTDNTMGKKQTNRHGILEGRRALDALGRALLSLVSYPKRPRAFFVSIF